MSIMRPSPLSNPFIIGVHGSRQQVLAAFERKVRREPELLARIAELDDVDLLCCCAPMPCHGDVILALWDELNHVPHGPHGEVDGRGDMDTPAVDG